MEKDREDVLEGKKGKEIKPYNVRAKAVGVKSSLLYNNNVYMTTFHLNNTSKLVEQIDANNNSKHMELPIPTYVLKEKKPNLIVKVQNEHVYISKKENGELKKINYANIHLNKNKNDTKQYTVRNDYINRKDEIEKEFFGKSFSGDNIHIQIAYNIFDIKKILGSYLCNLSYIFNNITYKDGDIPSDCDLFANINTSKTYRQFLDDGVEKRAFRNFLDFNIKAKPYFVYFNGILEPVEGKYTQNYDKKAANVVEIEDRNKEFLENNYSKLEHNYNILRILSLLRLFCTHNKLFSVSSESNIGDDIKQILDSTYSKRIEEINDNFLNNSKVNLKILCDIYKEELPFDIIYDYYNFAIKKEQKSLGVNITQIREEIYKKYIHEIIQAKEDNNREILSCLSKINGIFDFVVYKYLVKMSKSITKDDAKKNILQKMVEQLRSAMDDEDMKADIYEEYSTIIYDAIKSYYDSDTVMMICDYAKNGTAGDFSEYQPKLHHYLVPTSGVPDFVKMVFVLTYFLDGKENNELLASIIRKLEEIYDQIDCLCTISHKPVEFVKKYNMFNGINCKGMISQFKVVKSLTNKKQTLDGQAKIGLKIYLDAAKLLGVEIDESNIYKVDKNGKFIIGADKRPEMSEDFKGFWMQIYGEGKDKKVRNFIVNNVISSDRFFYLIKYCNAGTCRKYAQSEKLVDLVLRRLPDSQIDRYTKIIAPNTKAGESKRSVLAKEIMSLDFNYIFNNKKAISTEGNDKIRMQCLVSLYMTVIYIATKNLVKANARYFIAFSCLDRDYDLFNMLTAHQKENADGTIETRYEVGDYLALTEKFLSEEHYKTRVKEYLKGNLSEAKTLPAGVFSCYRNFISHMTAVTNAYKYIGEMNAEDKISYYSIFNYILQRYLNEVYIDSKNALPEWYKSCMQKVEQYHSYNKDVIKILNMPFAYNLPRYKNLSVEYLFNDLDNEAQKEQKRKEEKRKGK